MDREILDRIEAGEHGAWDLFLDTFAEEIFRVVCLFAKSYDDRMDLFLFICSKLEEDDMRRVRKFRFRPEAPCRLATWLSVVAKNLAIDFYRERHGRFRPFREVEAMESTDRLVFDYHLRDGRPLNEVRDLLHHRHGVTLQESDLAQRAARVREALSASQRWRLLARLTQHSRPLHLNPVTGAAGRDDEAIPLADDREDPERSLRSTEAGRALQEALSLVPTRQRLALVLRFRDGLTSSETAAVLRVPPPEAERLARAGLENMRETLVRSGFAPPDFEPASLAAVWPS